MTATAKGTGTAKGAAKAKGAVKLRATARRARGWRSKVVEGERTVEDPYEPGRKVKARVNLAEHPLELMRARGRIDDAQYAAGVRFRAIFERAVIGGGAGMDLSRIRVDGGGKADALTDSVAVAMHELRRVARELGLIGYRIVQAIAGEGRTLTDLASRWPGRDGERTRRDYLTLRLREALDTLALDVWGARGPDK